MFHFKQFSIEDDQCTMKVGTDGVLLGAWVDANYTNTILDIGTGCGLIALMLAQRSRPDTIIHGVEIAEADVRQARNNAAASPWPSKVIVHHSPIQLFQSDVLFDLVVTNPPFFNQSLLPPSASRAVARHTHSLTHAELLTHVTRLLSPEGRFAIVLPVVEGNAFRHLALTNGYHCHRSLAFFTRAGKPQERWLFEFARFSRTTINESLTLYEGDHWSEAYQRLTGAFYLDKK